MSVSGVNTQTGDYTLVLGDADYLVEMTKATAKALTVPPNSSVAFPVGTTIGVTNGGAGTLTITAGVGVTINASSSTMAQNESGVLVKVGTNTWYFESDQTGSFSASDITGATDISTNLTNDDVFILVNDPGGTPALRKATVTRIKEQVGGLLGSQSYYPGSPGAIGTTTSSSYADVDATNAKVTFTAPASGIVIIRVSAVVYTTASSAYAFGLHDGTSDISNTDYTFNLADQRTISVDWKITGLTAGSSYTVKLRHKRAGGTGTCGVYGGSGNGPFVMEAWSVPQ